MRSCPKLKMSSGVHRALLMADTPWASTAHSNQAWSGKAIKRCASNLTFRRNAIRRCAVTMTPGPFSSSWVHIGWSHIVEKSGCTHNAWSPRRTG